MRLKEDYARFVVTCFILTVAIFVAFQIYLLREPGRITTVEARDKMLAVEAGQSLFKQNCVLCHGDNGEGNSGPVLKDKTFLNTTDDDTLFNVISAGVPSTEMPAWNEVHGGPMTDEDVRQVVAFMRAWQSTATDIRAAPPNGDSDRGQTLYTNVCAVCHGDNGVGTDKALALNDPQKLKTFDDAWYRDTIAKGRPDKGMPTWGTVLAPQQISDLIALLDLWRQNGAPAAAITTTTAVTVTPSITTTQAPTPTTEIARPSNPGGPGPALALTSDVAAGTKLYVDNCQKCHGPQGTGGVANPDSDDGTIPPLNPIDETLVSQDTKVFATNLDLFIEHGSKPKGANPKEVMAAWGDTKKLTPQQIADVIAYVISLNSIK